ncbi:MAG TPA: J domain-containing protein [Solirubrobacteraceae bacterium]|jgi:DnaJ-class molecular chaperone
MADPYQTLGVSAGVSDAELRSAYRRLVRLHHPDHNGGSIESARRFEAVQEAYTQILTMRKAHVAQAAGAGREAGRQSTAPPSDPNVESRLARLERELRAAHAARERARQAAREAARANAPQRPSDEELGYVKTNDSFSKIFADAASELSERVSEVRRDHPVPKSLSDLIDELGSKLTGEPPER